MPDRTVRVRLVADVAQYRREIANASQQTKDLRAATQEVGSGLQRAGVGMVAAGGLMAAGLYRAGRAAADLEQSVGSTRAVFHDASGTIDAFADDAAEAMGLSERAFRDATTEIGGALRRHGFDVDEAARKGIELTQVGADLAATYGGTTAEAVHALGRAFAGEADPAERFNLDLRVSNVNAKAVALGLAETTTSVDAHARAQALLALIMEQSADAQGQFARELDTASGQMAVATAAGENFLAAFGAAVAPVLADAAGGLTALAEGFTNLPEPMQDVAGKLALALTGLTLFGGAANIVIGTVIKLRDNLERIGPAGAGASRVFGALARVGGYAVGIGATAAALSVLHDALEDVFVQDAPRVDDLTLALLDFIDSGRVAGAAAEVLGDDLHRLHDDLALLHERRSGFHIDIAEDFDEAVARIDAFDKALAQMVDSGKAELAAQLIEELGFAADGALVTEELNDYTSALTRVETQSRLTAGAGTDLMGATDDTTDAFGGAEDAALAAADAVRGYRDTLRAAFDPVFAMHQALRDQTAAQQDLNDVMSDAESTAADVEDALWRVQDANIAVDEAAVDLAAGLRDGSVSVSGFRDQLDRWVFMGAITADQARTMYDRFLEVRGVADSLQGRNVNVTASANTGQAMAALSDLDRRLRTLASSGVQINARVGQFVPHAAGGAVRGNADGTEPRPEPKALVIPARRTAPEADQGSTTRLEVGAGR